MTLIIDSGNATLILERGIKGADGTLPTLVMADITDKQGKVLDDLIEIENVNDTDTIFAVGGYIFKEHDLNGFFAGATMLVSANGGVVSQLISIPILGKMALRRYEAGVWSEFSFTIAPIDVQLWYGNPTASAADAVINADGTFSREVSTEEFKRDIEPMLDTHADGILAGLEPMWYRSTCERDNKEWSFWGLSAEHTATIDPRLVHWGHSTKEVPQPFGPPKTVIDYDSPLKPIGVQYSRIVPALLSVVKRQGAAIAALTARLDKLEGKV